jgi:hypothetical protein
MSHPAFFVPPTLTTVVDGQVVERKPRKAHGARWRKRRLERLRLARWKCEACGVSIRGPGRAWVHHLDPVWQGFPDDDVPVERLRALCRRCAWRADHGRA